MNLEKLQQELQTAQRELSEAKARCARHDAAHLVATKEIEEQRGALLSMMEDVKRDRQQVEQVYREWMAALDVVEDPIFLHDKQFRILRCNKAYQQRAGIPFKQIIGKPYYEIFPQASAPFACCLRVMEQAVDADGEEEVPVGDVIYRLRAFSAHDEQGAYLHSALILEDITERKLAEDALRSSEEQYRTMIENSNDMIWTLSADGKFTFINQRAADVTGRSIEDWLGESFVPLVFEDDRPMVFAMHGKIMRGEKIHYEVRGKKADGGILTLSVNASPIVKGGKVNGTISFARDITEQKLAEIAIAHANRALATLSTVNRTLVHASNEEALLQAICQAIIQQRGYQLAWVGYAQYDEQKTVKVMAQASLDSSYIDAMQPTWAANDRGMGPCGRAIRSGATQVCQDIANDPHFRPWRDEALKRGYNASIALPLANEHNAVFGTLTVYSNEVNAFSPAEVDLLEEMAGDMAFGVCILHVRKERDLALQQNQSQLTKLQDSLEDTVRAIATIVEMRDPYTSGHQVRVADLAVAIARQMKLPDEQVHAIHLAGVVHDLGKIRIPAEILSKPGRITDVEFALIKVHAQAGYDILKDIKFPWPIAQMVQQHHERLDGSGYPQGLKGEEILLGARILSVADVVEAIFSHRPYRPGLGMSAALGEVIRLRGTHYDAQVVDACVLLIQEQKYELPK
jgi:PAS domain S-box-containing protein